MKRTKFILGSIIFIIILFLLINNYKEDSDKTTKDYDLPLKVEGSLYFLRKKNERPFIKVNIKLAETTLEKIKGLMFRKHLGENEGMLFVFERPKETNFYMRNTFIPLDIIFIDQNNRIISIGEGVPLTETLIPSKGKCSYVLEVNKGFSKKYNVNIGDYIKWRRF